MIWFKEPNLDEVNNWCKNTAVDHSEIIVTEINDDSLIGTMPVDHKTVQPQRRLHGGASCLLSESLGSIAANLTLDSTKEVAFGISIEANHLRPAGEGSSVRGVTKPIHLGKTIHVWETNIYDDRDRLICNSKLTMAIVKTRST